MTEPNQPRPPRRRNADYRWTRQKAIAFLHALRACGSVARAARSVGMSRQSAYRLRARYGADYAAVWDEGVALWRRYGPPPPRPAPPAEAGSLQGDAQALQGDGPCPAR